RWPWEFENFGHYGRPVADKLVRVLESEQPDFLLVDPMLWGGMTAAEASLIPWASLAHNPLMFRGAGMDVRGPGLRTPRTPLGRLSRSILDRLQRRDMDQRHLDVVNDVRKRMELFPPKHADEIYRRAPLVLV